MLAVVRREMDHLADSLRAAAEAAGEEPRRRLLAACHAYLDLARTHPGRYRIMFGGLWMPSVEDNSLTEDDLEDLGADALQVVADAVAACVATGQSTSDDPTSDAVALWLGLHGLAHQRSVVREFPWPSDIEHRIIGALARLTD
jgi:AcrR family transcriptional regulator